MTSGKPAAVRFKCVLCRDEASVASLYCKGNAHVRMNQRRHAEIGGYRLLTVDISTSARPRRGGKLDLAGAAGIYLPG